MPCQLRRLNWCVTCGVLAGQLGPRRHECTDGIYLPSCCCAVQRAPLLVVHAVQRNAGTHQAPDGQRVAALGGLQQLFA